MAIFLNNSNSTSVQRTPTFNIVTTAGTIPAGTKSVTVANTGTKTGTLIGTNIVPGMVVEFNSTGNDILGTILYDPTKDSNGSATGTTFTIVTLT